MKKTTISIVALTYNHEKFVVDFMRSIQEQTYSDFKVFIIDDNSGDSTVKLLESYDDERIQIIKHKHNYGIAYGMNEGVPLVNSDYYALVSVDDMLRQDFIAKTMELIEKNPDVDLIYPKLSCIDENSQKINIDIPLNKHKNINEILHDSFLNRNQLSSPGMVVRHSFVKNITIPFGAFIYSDYVFHNKLLLNKAKVAFINDATVLYRKVNNSASFDSFQNDFRCCAETKFSMEPFLEIKDVDFLLQIFPEITQYFNNISEREIPYILGFLATKSNIQDKQVWGYLTCLNFVSDSDNFEYLNKKYNFSFKDLLALCPNGDNSEIIKLRRKNRILRKTRLALSAVSLILLLAIIVVTF